LDLARVHFVAKVVLHLASFMTTYTLLGEITWLVSGLSGAWAVARIIWELEFRFPEKRSIFLRTAIAIIVFELTSIDLRMLTSRIFSHSHLSFSSIAWYSTALLSLSAETGASTFAYKFFRRPVDHWISDEATRLAN
jgi:hypothetical protein